MPSSRKAKPKHKSRRKPKPLHTSCTSTSEEQGQHSLPPSSSTAATAQNTRVLPPHVQQLLQSSFDSFYVRNNLSAINVPRPDIATLFACMPEPEAQRMLRDFETAVPDRGDVEVELVVHQSDFLPAPPSQEGWGEEGWVEEGKGEEGCSEMERFKLAGIRLDRAIVRHRLAYVEGVKFLARWAQEVWGDDKLGEDLGGNEGC